VNVPVPQTDDPALPAHVGDRRKSSAHILDPFLFSFFPRACFECALLFSPLS
jgi:hypothetical protein